MSPSNDGGYVHDPSTFDEDATPRGSRDDSSDGAGRSGTDSWLEEPIHPESADREFGWRGWVLVGVIVFAFIVAPVAIVLWPPHLNYFVALLILPLAPALLLAVAAVWATTRP